MNYAVHYDRLINRAIGRELDGYVESHHAIPRCVGGPDRPDNLVRLTAEEHYVAHQLLVKLLPHHAGLAIAAKAMTISRRDGRRKCNKWYGWLRRRFAKAISDTKRGVPLSAEHRASMSLAKLGTTREPHTAATKIKMRAASLGRKKSEAHCAALSTAKKKHYVDQTNRARQAAHLINARAAHEHALGVSGHRGVTQLPGGGWCARFFAEGKTHHVGVFKTADKAARAVILAKQRS